MLDVNNPCSCGGENPNCFKCSGTGCLGARTQSGERATDAREFSPQSLIRCPVAGCKALVKSLAKHLRKAHGGARRDSKPTESRETTVSGPAGSRILAPENLVPKARRRSTGVLDVKVLANFCGRCGLVGAITASHNCLSKSGTAPRPPARPQTRRAPQEALVACPHCPGRMPERALAAHLLRKHPAPSPTEGTSTSASRAQEPTKPRGKPNKPRKLVQGFPCSRCRVVAPTQLVLDEHMRRVHRFIRHGDGSGGARRTDEDDSRAPAHSMPRNELDATYGWGGSWRDHGQFGSHPSYDRMDDDSTA